MSSLDAVLHRRNEKSGGFLAIPRIDPEIGVRKVLVPPQGESHSTIGGNPEKKN